MELKININEERIIELVEKEIVNEILKDRTYINREAKYGVMNGVDKAVKQYIYDKKDTIIDRVIERASVEIVKKGLPKLLDRLGNELK